MEAEAEVKGKQVASSTKKAALGPAVFDRPPVTLPGTDYNPKSTVALTSRQGDYYTGGYHYPIEEAGYVFEAEAKDTTQKVWEMQPAEGMSLLISVCLPYVFSP
jgi:hypothetical protein